MAWTTFAQEFRCQVEPVQFGDENDENTHAFVHEVEGESHYRVCALNTETGEMHLGCKHDDHNTPEEALACEEAKQTVAALQA